jgi:hypothetical protein
MISGCTVKGEWWGEKPEVADANEHPGRRECIMEGKRGDGRSGFKWDGVSQGQGAQRAGQRRGYGLEGFWGEASAKARAVAGGLSHRCRGLAKRRSASSKTRALCTTNCILPVIR